ncbi:MAG: polysaccharide biosynthesis C-terminal domain-containing protein [Candidatus Hydrogenedentes bacterium]|nr:polysaccharide biosynthesis C-terminal domain-containing protein [Candidatus Hydrogenedentota bacterium]
MKQRFLQGAAYSTGSMIYSTLALLVAGKLMTNALTPEAVGQVALLLILGELLGTCCNLGLTAALPKLLPACDEPGRAGLLGALLPFQMLSALLMAAVCGLGALFAPWWRPLAEGFLPLPVALLWLAPPLLLIITLRDFLLAAAAGLHAYGLRAGAIMLMSSLQMLTFGALFVLGVEEAFHYALAYIVSGAAGTGLLLRIAPRPYGWDGPLVRRQVGFSAPLFANTLLGFAYQRLDTVIVVYFLGVGSAAVFEMAKRIPGVVARFLNAGLVPYLPSIAGLLRDSGRDGAGLLLQRASAYSAFTGYLATLAVVAVQEPLLAALFTTDYEGAAPAMGPLLIAACLATQAGLMGQALIALDRPVLVMNINVGLAAIGIGLNLLLIPQFGLAGAGWSAAAAAWFSFVLQRAAVARAGLPLTRSGALWITIFFVATYGFAWWMNSVFWTLVAALVYGAACLGAGSVSFKELRTLLRREEAP